VRNRIGFATPFPWMTTRRWMVAVAVVIVAILLVVELRRFRQLTLAYRTDAKHHASLRQLHSDMRDAYAQHTEFWARLGAALKEDSEESEELKNVAKEYCKLAERENEVATYHALLESKYQSASRYPWLPVPPDPPEPE